MPALICQVNKNVKALDRFCVWKTGPSNLTIPPVSFRSYGLFDLTLSSVARYDVCQS